MRNPSMVRFARRGLGMAGLILLLTACNGFPFRAHPQGTASASPQGTGTVSPQVISGTANIVLQDNEFHPKKLTLKVGTTIIWVNKDPAFHSVIEDNDVFRSSLLAIGQSFSYTFNTAGTYPYYCGVKGGPGGKGMSGEITVVP